ncbi:MAG: aminoacyl-tRNA hydrolase [Limnobacter sp.]|nr:aminoacyl-tRNA hydrolase [Limnobacter sp.]
MTTSNPIKLIVGLGNPGPQYVDTRHNAGVWFVEKIARQMGQSLRPENRFLGEMAKMKHKGEDLFFLFPTTFMNRSGQSVGAVAKFFKIQPQEILVAHDELDLLPGQLKIKRGGGHAGHNGLRDIQAHLGTNDYWRARIGIGHPRTLNLSQSVSDFVLHRAPAEQQADIDAAMDTLLTHSHFFLEGQFSQASTKIHTEIDLAFKKKQSELQKSQTKQS